MAEPCDESIEEAAQRLRAGSVVAFPTETVYGLGAGTFNAPALEKVFHLKDRPRDNPLSAHVADVAGAREVVTRWDDRCAALAELFWPGPLTLVLPKDERVPSRATAGRPTIAVRCPRHPVAERLIRAFGGPVSAPSANRSGHVSPTTARHVAADFADVDDLMILDGGPCQLGLESTVLDLTGARPRILRPGAVTEPQLRDALGEVESPLIGTAASGAGLSPRQYAPHKPAALVEPEDLDELLAKLSRPAAVLCFEAATVPPPHQAIEMPQGAGTYAQGLYEALRRADAMGVDCIIIEAPPETNELWKAIRDRLARATSGI